MGFPVGSVVKNLPANAGDVGLISGLGRSPREGNGNSLQYYCLGDHVGRGLGAVVHGPGLVTQKQTNKHCNGLIF